MNARSRALSAREKDRTDIRSGHAVTRQVAEAAGEVVAGIVVPHRLETGGYPIPGLLQELGVIGRVIGLEKARRRPEPVDLQADLGIVVRIERPFEDLDVSGPAERLGLGEEGLHGLLVVRRFEKAEESRPDPEPLPRWAPLITTASRATGGLSR